MSIDFLYGSHSKYCTFNIPHKIQLPTGEWTAINENMTSLEKESGTPSDQEVNRYADITCNCELCQARLYVSARQSIDEECTFMADQTDGFHLLPSFKSIPYSSNFNMPIVFPWLCQMPLYTDPNSLSCGNYGKCICADACKVIPGGMPYPHSIYENACRCSLSEVSCDADQNANGTLSVPQVYISKDSVLHIRLSNYVSFERSISAYRLINYRNNSALALSESGEYGYAYHSNCRGLINMHHGKLSITFDKDRQVLLRSEKPSFVKKEMEFYRLTSHHWTACRPVSMDMFDRDRTPEILKKPGVDKSTDDEKLRKLMNSSAVHREGCGLVSELLRYFG